jgi:hypothetical protein
LGRAKARDLLLQFGEPALDVVQPGKDADGEDEHR